MKKKTISTSYPHVSRIIITETFSGWNKVYRNITLIGSKGHLNWEFQVSGFNKDLPLKIVKD